MYIVYSTYITESKPYKLQYHINQYITRYTKCVKLTSSAVVEPHIYLCTT